jgi:hypothetical protein
VGEARWAFVGNEHRMLGGNVYLIAEMSRNSHHRPLACAQNAYHPAGGVVACVDQIAALNLASRD